jgi:hypothetical protein
MGRTSGRFKVRPTPDDLALQQLGADNEDEEAAMTLSKEQREAVETGRMVPLTVDGIDCVLLRADVYDKVRTVLSDDLSHDELRALLARSASASDWLDPSMDVYDEYDKHR